MSIINKLKLIVPTIALTYLGVNMLLNSTQSIKSIKRLENLKTEVSGLELRRDNLKEEIAYKNTDEYIEEKARNDLNLVKPGEKVYVIGGLEPEDEFLPTQDKFKELSENSERVRPEIAGSMTSRPPWLDWYYLFFK